MLVSNGSSAGRLFWIFLKLGATSFGGPIAHLAMFRREFVKKRQWVSESEFAEMIALCQSLPGPSSSQVALLIAHLRCGYAGALAAFAGFTLPGAVMLTLAAFWLGGHEAMWIQGLRVFAVAMVSQAVWAMAKSLTPDWRRRSIAVGAVAVCVGVGGGTGQILAIAVGGVLGQILCKETVAVERFPSRRTTVARVVVPLAVFAVLLAAVVLVPLDGAPMLVRLCAGMYRAGALVFGGGHVVLPLLNAEVVDRLGMPSSVFLSGYGLVQGMPGPIFNVAAWVGASMSGIVGSVVATLSIFLPGALVVLGARQIWNNLRGWTGFQRSLAGTNAAVVGILFAALVQVVIPDGIRSVGDGVLAVAALGVLVLRNWPPWGVALLCAGIGLARGVFGG